MPKRSNNNVKAVSASSNQMETSINTKVTSTQKNQIQQNDETRDPKQDLNDYFTNLDEKMNNLQW